MQTTQENVLTCMVTGVLLTLFMLCMRSLRTGYSCIHQDQSQRSTLPPIADRRRLAGGKRRPQPVDNQSK